MPNPDNPPQQKSVTILKDILSELTAERVVAAQRYQDILEKMTTQHEQVERQHSELLAKIATSHGFVGNSVAMELKRFEHIVEQRVSDCTSTSARTAATQKLTALAKNLGENSAANISFEDLEEMDLHSFRRRLKKFVTGQQFEYFFAILILANAMVMCLEAQRRGLEVGCDVRFSSECGHPDKDGHRAWIGSEHVFAVLDWSLGIMFTIEVILKIGAYTTRFFCGIWDIFDFICVVVFLFDKVATALIDMGTAEGARITENVSRLLRLMRLLRLIRLVRLMRVLFSVDALYVMVTAIKGMTWVVIWGMLLLCVMLTICALFLCMLLHTTYFKDHDQVAGLSPKSLEAQHQMFEYFGTFMRCFLSMFEITLGNWPPVARLLVEEYSSLFMPICLIHKLTIGFAVVGVINGCILQETFKVASIDDVIMVRQKRREQATFQKKMSLLFDALDVQDDGELTYDEFQAIMANSDLVLWLSSMGIGTGDLHALFNLLDTDHNGMVSRTELIGNMQHFGGTSRNIDVQMLCRQLIPNYNC